tara:strand:+ start:1142 stop:2344 length:1203 start_codon:yes stop_codon:yes gene_type:complete
MGGFDFGAFLGGMGEQISENIESAKAFNREKDFRLDMLAEEEATKNRLAKSKERKEKNELVQKLTESLSIHIGADNAAAMIKTHGVGGANIFLDKANSYEGDLSTAIKLPEIKNGTFGDDLVAAPTLSQMLPFEEKPEKLATTIAGWQINFAREMDEANAMADGDEKKNTIAALNSKKEQFLNVLGETEEVKRAKEKAKEGGFYTDAQMRAMYDAKRDSSFGILTGFAGARENYVSEVKGANTLPFSDYQASIQLYEENKTMMNDKYLTTFATNSAKNAKNALYVHATEILRQTRGDANTKQIDAMTYPRIQKAADGILTEEQFDTFSETDGVLKQRGVYIIKNKDMSLSVITYLGFGNIFNSSDPSKKYITHARTTSINEDAFNNLLTYGQRRFGKSSD